MCIFVAHGELYLCAVIQKSDHIISLTMSTINSSDIIFARVYRMGREIANLRLTGVSSEAEVFAELRRHIGSSRALLDLVLRNGTQGWSSRRPVMS